MKYTLHYIQISVLLISLFCFLPLHQLFAENNVLMDILNDHPEYFKTILDNPDQYKVQILYTQIDRDSQNRPSFHSYSFHVDTSAYFYPASTVKMPAAALALEKLNTLNIPGLDHTTPLRVDSAYAGQTIFSIDTTKADSLPSVGHFIKKVFLVSDNAAFNRLYEFLGQQCVNELLWQKGFQSVRIIHRLSRSLTLEENRHTNPMTFYQNDSVIYHQNAQYNPRRYSVRKQNIRIGEGYMSGDSLVSHPMDFTYKNFISIPDEQGILKAIMFPEYIPDSSRFHLSRDQYRFLWKQMSMYPGESEDPVYDPETLPPSSNKFFMYGDSAQSIPKNIRIFNKIGGAYGFLMDNAYIVDFTHHVEFLLTAVIYTNPNEILNDDEYAYDKIGLPFLAHLGKVVYAYEIQRKRPFKPDLTQYQFDYGH